MGKTEHFAQINSLLNNHVNWLFIGFIKIYGYIILGKINGIHR
jgi:hypothetical protein